MNALLPVTTRPLPHWLPTFETQKTWTDATGRVHLAPGTNLTSEMRMELRACASTFRHSLAGATERELAPELAKLFAVYPSRDGLSEVVHAARIAGFMEPLHGYPLWAIQTAIGMWTRGENLASGDDTRWCPVPAQLIRLAKIAMAPVEREVARLETMATAVVDDEPRPRLTEEELRAKFGEDWGLTEEYREKAMARHRATVVRGNEEAKRQEFEAAGMEYRPDSLEASPALLSRLDDMKADEAWRRSREAGFAADGDAE